MKYSGAFLNNNIFLIKTINSSVNFTKFLPLSLYLSILSNILSKSLGSSTKINIAYATLDALKQQKTAEEVAKLRGKKVEEL